MPESLRYVPTDPCLDRLCLDFRTGLSVERPLGGPRPGYCPHRERDELEESLQSACNITIRESKLIRGEYVCIGRLENQAREWSKQRGLPKTTPECCISKDFWRIY